MGVTVRGHLARLTGLPITTAVLLRLETCAAIGAHLLAELGLGAPAPAGPAAPARDRWLRVLRTASTPQARILCAAGMGGTTSAHLPLSRHLPDGIEVLGIQLPGREARAGEAPVSDMAAVIDGVLTALDARPALPTVLYGHSQGSWIAWELAHRLSERGVTDLGLVVACSLPPLASPTPALRRLETLADSWDDVSPARLAEMFRGILPDQVLDSEQLLAEYVSALRCDVALAADHGARLRSRPHGLLDIPVRAVEAAADPVLPAGAMRAWADLTVGRWTVQVVQGSHAAPIENAPALAAQLTAMTDELTGAASATELELVTDR
jgi:surfactin synthase thioesterase subunit